MYEEWYFLKPYWFFIKIFCCSKKLFSREYITFSKTFDNTEFVWLYVKNGAIRCQENGFLLAKATMNKAWYTIAKRTLTVRWHKSVYVARSQAKLRSNDAPAIQGTYNDTVQQHTNFLATKHGLPKLLKWCLFNVADQWLAVLRRDTRDSEWLCWESF